jgi:hypothetical protein
MLSIYKNRSLGVGEKPIVRVKYTHMLKEDYATWSAFLESDIIRLDEVWYDVHVGREMAVPPGSPEYMLAVVSGISRKRIDVVGRSGGTIYIIEVKPHANMEAIGQVITYRELFVKEFEISGPVRMLVVSQTSDADILKTAQDLQVKVIPMKGVVL